MNYIKRNLRNISAAMAALVVGVAAVGAFGQDVIKEKLKADVRIKENSGFCSNNNWSSNDRVSFNELRETTISAGAITVDAGKNGGIGIKGEDRGDILVKACIQAWGPSDAAARAAVSSVRINTAGVIKADGADDQNFSVSYQILVPKNTSLKLVAHNGGISISNVDSTAEFATMNGGVSLMNVAGDFRGRTQNGGVTVSLTGRAWKGTGLDVNTLNGGVHISIPEDYSAHIETGTVNGGFSSDIPALDVVARDANGHRRPGAKISTSLNGGGAPIRVGTTNGGVRITSQRHYE
jgi:hypothetical protein